jgi:hypothetical protein
VAVSCGGVSGGCWTHHWTLGCVIPIQRPAELHRSKGDCLVHPLRCGDAVSESRESSVYAERQSEIAQW